jgi:hypothetical protein
LFVVQLSNLFSLERLVDSGQIVAVGLLTRREVDLLGPGFTRLWPVEETPCFSGLLRAIDEADREIRRARDAASAG